MIVKRENIKVTYDEVTPEEWGKELADEMYWRFNGPVQSLDSMDKMSNSEAQQCVDAFVNQLYERFNLQGYNLKKPF